MPTDFQPPRRGLILAACAALVVALAASALVLMGGSGRWAWLTLPASALMLMGGVAWDGRTALLDLRRQLARRQEDQRLAELAELEREARALASTQVQQDRSGWFRDDAIRSAQISIWQLDLRMQALTIEGVHLGGRDFSGETRQWRLRDWLRSLHPEDRRKVTTATDDFFAGRTTDLRMEFRVNDERDGWRWVLAHGDVTQRDQQGHPEKVAGTLLDVHHHKLTQIARNQEHGLLEAGPVVVFRFKLDTSLAVDFVSGNAARLWKREGTSWQPAGESVADWLHGHDAVGFMQEVLGAHQRGDSGFISQVRVRMGDGAHRWQSLRLLFEHEHHSAYARGYLIDIEERKRLEALAAERNSTMEALVAQLHRSQADNAALQECSDRLNSAEDGVEASRIISHVATLLFPGWSGCLFVHGAQGALEKGTTWGHPPEQDDEFDLQDCWALRRGKPHTFFSDKRHIRCRHLHLWANRDLRPYLCIPMAAHGETVGSLHLYADGLFSEAQVHQVLNQAGRFCETVKLALSNLRLRSRLKEQATRDPLTGLYNRRLLDERLPIEFRRSHRDGQPLALALLDIDHFKAMNDEHGHDAGDAVLRALGAYLIEQTRAYDIACRYGGEELVLMMPGCQTADAVLKLELIRQGIAAMRIEHLGALLPPVTVSIGLARSQDDGPLALLRRADAALYQAKHQGRNRLVVHDPEHTLSPGHAA